MRKNLLSDIRIAAAVTAVSMSCHGITAQAGNSTDAIFGSVISSNDDMADLGIYRLPLDGSQMELVEWDIEANGGGFFAHGKYYMNWEREAYGDMYYVHFIYDATSWRQLYREDCEHAEDMAYDMAYDPTLDRAFGCFISDDGSKAPVFGSMNLEDFSVTRIGANLERPLRGIAISRGGIVYGIDSWGILYKIDKYSGSLSEIGDTKIESYYTTSAVYDDNSGKIYYLQQGDNVAALYSIDPESAEAVKLYDMPNNEQVSGLYIPFADADGDAPEAVKDLQVAGSGSSMQYAVTFTAPSLSFSGQQLADEGLGYEILVNCVPAKSGTVMPGMSVSETVDFPAKGNYDVTVFVSNSAGKSPVAVKTVYAGNDVPAALDNVSLVYDGEASTMTLTWDEVSPVGIKGGFVDPDKTTYTVTRYPDMAEFGGLTLTTFTDKVEEPQDGVIHYYYTIAAVFDGESGASVSSNAINLGSVRPPYLEPFDSEQSLETFTIVAKNWNTWTFAGDAVQGKGDSWLITPAITLEKGKYYDLAFKVKGLYSYWEEAFEVSMGNEPAVESMSMPVIGITSIKTDQYTDQSAVVTVPDDGRYYLGFHYTNKGISIIVDDISLSAGTEYPCPSALVVSRNGDAGALLNWTAPEIPAGKLELVGYNIYRDGVIINEEPVTETSFADESLTGDSYRYYVTAVYGNGESVPSNIVEFSFSGIEGIVSDESAAPVYYNLQGIRVDNPHSGVYIIKKGSAVTKQKFIR